MAEPLCVMTVHAHPDDEASKGAPTIARYHAEGVRTVLVCCTDGAEGEVQNPAMDLPEVKENIAAVRAEELRQSVEAIGYDDLIMLGYRDSGMPESEANAHPESFHQAPTDEAVGRLVAVIRATRPQVIITYSDDQQGYPHPDHLKVHDISVLAFERAGDRAWYPDAGESWRPLKLYYTIWSRARLLAWHDKFAELGLKSPYDDKWFERPWQDDRITTRLDIRDHWHVRRAALIAHATQVDPNESFWFGLPDDAMVEAYPWEDWVLSASHVGFPPPGTVEDDLFAGIRTAVHG
ncbi:MAG: mycothiol conjugate amidase Mca [Acidimicrobiales bacterium]